MTLSVMDEPYENSCTGEVKTDFLTLCSGTGGVFSPNNSKRHTGKAVKIRSERPAVNNRMALLKYDTGVDKSHMLQRPNRPTRVSNSTTSSSQLPRLVKVSLFTKAADPYLVIFDSNRQYSKPSTYVKLTNCAIQRPGTPDDSDDQSFCLVPKKHMDDADGSSTLKLRASTAQSCEEWVRLLTDLAKGGVCSEQLVGYVPGSSVMPTLEEQEDDESSVTSSVENLKVTQRKKANEGRRSSLNSLGIRLRSYNNGILR